MSLADQIEDAQKACRVMADPVATADELDRLRRERDQWESRAGQYMDERDAYKDAATARDRNEDELRRELTEAREAKYVVMLLRKYSPSLCADFEKDARAAMAEPKEVPR